MTDHEFFILEDEKIVDKPLWFSDRSMIKTSVLLPDKLVSDNGLGIPPEVLPRVFEPFFTSGRRDLQHTHLGLGLTLCKLIVKHHQGDISILSTSEAGTSVNFTISRDLKGEQEISEASVNLCYNTGDWVYDARRFAVAVSDNGTDFREVAAEDYPEMTEDQYGSGISTHALKFAPVKARYVKVTLSPEYNMPENRGFEAFIFVDEIKLR